MVPRVVLLTESEQVELDQPLKFSCTDRGKTIREGLVDRCGVKSAGLIFFDTGQLATAHDRWCQHGHTINLENIHTEIFDAEQSLMSCARQQIKKQSDRMAIQWNSDKTEISDSATLKFRILKLSSNNEGGQQLENLFPNCIVRHFHTCVPISYPIQS